MTSENAFQIYFALKLHFTSSYDVFTSGINFKGKGSVKDRNDFNLILPIIKQVDTERQLVEFCVSNHLYGNPDFLYNDIDAYDHYKHWSKVKESLEYTLDKDLSYIELFLLKNRCDFDEYLSNHVISDLLSNKIEYESLILLNHSCDIINKISGFDAVKYKVRMHKASRFVNKGTLGHRHSSRINIFKQSI